MYFKREWSQKAIPVDLETLIPGWEMVFLSREDTLWFCLYYLELLRKKCFWKDKKHRENVVTQMFCNLRSQTSLGQQVILKISKLSTLKRQYLSLNSVCWFWWKSMCWVVALFHLVLLLNRLRKEVEKQNPIFPLTMICSWGTGNY